MQVADKTVVIAGLGVSGTSLAEVLRERGAHVIGVDERKPEADLHSFDDVDWDHVDYVMSSPVFNPRTPFVLEAQRRGIPVMSEVEFAWQLRVNNERTGTPAPWIGITGTNGKTSTTEMTSEMLTACGLDAPTAGNIASGDMSMSLSRCATNPQHDVLCVELSSFQLHFTDSLALDCAAITNIADDHLDWHGGIDNYASDKAKVFHHAKKALVYNADDERVTANWRPRLRLPKDAARWDSRSRPLRPARSALKMAGSWTGAAWPAAQWESRSDWPPSPISRIWQSRTAHCTRIWWPMH